MRGRSRSRRAWWKRQIMDFLFGLVFSAMWIGTLIIGLWLRGLGI